MALLGAITADREQYVSLTDQYKGSRAAFMMSLSLIAATARVTPEQFCGE